jgi:hypothetical protein
MMHRIGAQGFTQVRVGTLEALFAGSTTSNKFLWLFSPDGTDDGVTINSIVTVAPNAFGNPMLTKYLRRARVVGRGKFNFQLVRNYQSSVLTTASVTLPSTTKVWNSGVWSVGTWGPDDLTQDALINLDAYGKVFSIQITDSEVLTGKQPMSLGSKDYIITRGEWALYQVTFDGQLLGLRS